MSLPPTSGCIASASDCPKRRLLNAATCTEPISAFSSASDATSRSKTSRPSQMHSILSLTDYSFRQRALRGHPASRVLTGTRIQQELFRHIAHPRPRDSAPGPLLDLSTIVVHAFNQEESRQSQRAAGTICPPPVSQTYCRRGYHWSHSLQLGEIPCPRSRLSSR